MEAKVTGAKSFQVLDVTLNPGEYFYSEAGKMVRCTDNIDTEVTTQKRSGGIMGALKRMLSGDSFFMSRYTAGRSPGQVVVAPTMMGSIAVLEQSDRSNWITTGGSYLASGPEVKSEAKWQGLGSALLSGESILLLHHSGIGFLAVEAFGSLREIEVDGEFIVDTGHVVAYQSTLNFEVKTLSSSWLTSFLSGEGFVLKFAGKGKLWIQSHNPPSFGGEVGPLLPKRR